MMDYDYDLYDAGIPFIALFATVVCISYANQQSAFMVSFCTLLVHAGNIEQTIVYYTHTVS